jgi:hypothetical protein
MVVDPNRSRIIEWDGRDLGLPQSPKWLVDLRQGNDGTVKEQFNLDDLGTDAVVKLIPIRNTNLRTAQAQGLTQLAAVLSTEVRTDVNMETQDSLSDDQETTTQDIVMKAQFAISGMRQVTTYWHQVETTNSAGRSTQAYVYYVVFATGRAQWASIVRAYMNSVLGELMKDPSNRQTATAIARLTEEITAATAETKAWNRDELEYMRLVAEEKRQDANTARDQQNARDMQADRLAVASLRETEQTARNATNAAAGTERTALSPLPPERQKALAASVTPADTDWISSLLDTGMGIIF